MAEWIPVFLMPNLRVAHDITVDEMAIVPSTDERLQAYETKHPQFRQFLQKFTDPFGARVSPGVLLLRSDAPETFKSIEAVSSFRDLLALSVIPFQRAKGTVHDGSHHIQYSDYFDFYPWVYHEGHKHLVCNTPAQVSLHEIRVFRGQTSPILSALEFDHIDVDSPLLNALLQRWRIRYGTKRPQWSDRALFRSLNMAAAASKMPAGVDLTTFSLGRNIGLWVSAFEILTHRRPAPEQTQQISSDIRIRQRRVSDIRTMIRSRKSRRRALVETCSDYPESCDRNAARLWIRTRRLTGLSMIGPNRAAAFNRGSQ